MQKIIILDFGSQYTQLIARRVRDLGVLAEIYPNNISLEKIIQHKPAGIILSGGPKSVNAKDAQGLEMGGFKSKNKIVKSQKKLENMSIPAYTGLFFGH